MRFSAPRSVSPSPVRQSPRRRSTFGVNAHDPANGSDASEGESDASSSSLSSDSFCYASESEVPSKKLKPKRVGKSTTEQRRTEETVAAIRLRLTHHDPYEEWERQTRKDAFRTARRNLAVQRSQLHQDRDHARAADAQRLADSHARQVQEVQSLLGAIDLQRRTEEQKIKDVWKERDRRARERIEAAIKVEEDQLKARLEAERKVREEEGRKRREEEESRIREELRRKEQEERKRKEEEEKKRREKEKEEEQRKQDEAQMAQEEQRKKEVDELRSLGATTAEEDWKHARNTLKSVKGESMKAVKADRDVKSQWSKLRRQITPKVGQITNDPAEIIRISQQLCDIVRPTQPHPTLLYHALLSSLAKAILLQAETEVTAEKRSAAPLAQVTANLLSVLEDFADVFWAKLCQRAGGWPVPIVVPSSDFDGTPFEEAQRRKAHGYREGEGMAEYGTRVAGMMRVYFHIIFAPLGERPLDKKFQRPRYWTYFARMLAEPRLLATAIAPQILYAALDVGGEEAKDTWGKQWVKMLALLYAGLAPEPNGTENKRIGGESSEGRAARVRMLLEVERVMNDSH